MENFRGSSSLLKTLPFKVSKKGDFTHMAHFLVTRKQFLNPYVQDSFTKPMPHGCGQICTCVLRIKESSLCRFKKTMPWDPKHTFIIGTLVLMVANSSNKMCVYGGAVPE